VVKHVGNSNVAGFPVQYVSDKFASYINRYLEGSNKPSDSEINELTNHEGQLYKRLLNVTGSTKHNSESIDDLKKRLKLIEGEINAKNDNPSLLAEAKEILNTFAKYGRITRKEAKRYYIQLQQMMYDNDK